MNDCKGVLYYDGSCSFCVRWISRIRSPLAGKNIRVRSFEKGTSEVEMKLVWHDRREFGGADAAFFIARRFLRLFPIGLLGMLPGFRSLGRYIYRRIAANRYCRGGRNASCQIEFNSDVSPNQKRAVIAGGSGFLGRALAERLVLHGWQVVVLTRHPHSYQGKGYAVYWDGKTCDPDWTRHLEGASALINLTGKNVNCRPHRKNRLIILQSRVDSVRVLGVALRTVQNPPEVWVQASSLAIYGNSRDQLIDESGFVPEDEYPASVCVAWEEELGRAIRTEMRCAILRIGFVLGREGGALPFLARLTRLGLGGSIGDGKQWISWIHLDDMLAVFLAVMEQSDKAGIFNVASLQPVTNAEFMTALRKTLHRPWSPAAPRWTVKIGAPLLNSDPDIALTGRRCLPLRLHEAGFRFEYQNLEDALADLFEKQSSQNSLKLNTEH